MFPASRGQDGMAGGQSVERDRVFTPPEGPALRPRHRRPGAIASDGVPTQGTVILEVVRSLCALRRGKHPRDPPRGRVSAGDGGKRLPHLEGGGRQGEVLMGIEKGLPVPASGRREEDRAQDQGRTTFQLAPLARQPAAFGDVEPNDLARPGSGPGYRSGRRSRHVRQAWRVDARAPGAGSQQRDGEVGGSPSSMEHDTRVPRPKSRSVHGRSTCMCKASCLQICSSAGIAAPGGVDVQLFSKASWTNWPRTRLPSPCRPLATWGNVCGVSFGGQAENDS
jgi:hypothetical protein